MKTALAKQPGKSHFVGWLLQLHLLGDMPGAALIALQSESESFGEEEKNPWAPHYFIFKTSTWMF